MASQPAPSEDAYGIELDAEQQRRELERFREQQEQELLRFLRVEEENADDEILDDERAVALDFYNGEPFGDEEDGRSQLVTRDVAEVIDYMTTSIINTMISGDNVAEFTHEDSNIAEQATAAVNRSFLGTQRGYRIVHDWVKAGLLEKSSVLKVTAVESDPKRREAVVPELALAQMQMDGVEIVEAIDNGDGSFNVAWFEPQPVRFVDEVIPNEEAKITEDARDMDDDCIYWAHVTPKTLSELERMGFDTTQIPNIGIGEDETPLWRARDGRTGMRSIASRERTGPNRKVMLREEYAQFDMNGDLVTERIAVHRVEDRILTRRDTGQLSIFEIDEQPGVLWCPFPMQHRLVGQSLADKVMDIQRTRSVLLRQAMDNLYQSNNPRVAVHENGIGDNTIDDLLTIRPGAIVRWTGAVKPEPFAVPFVAGAAFEAMEFMSGERETRTGITRLNQGLDADTISKTASGQARLQALGQQIEQYVARNFAEAFSVAMLKKYRLMRKYGQPFRMRLGGEFVDVDPSQWPEDMEIEVRVGLGSGQKDQRLAYRMELLNVQREALQLGLSDDEKIYNNLAGIVSETNLGNVNDYFVDPATLVDPETGERPERPDPAMVEAQARAQIESEKVNNDRLKIQSDALLKEQQQQVDAALAQQRNDQNLAIKAEAAALDAQLKRDKAAEEARLAQAKFEFEASLARERLDFEMSLAREKQAVQTATDTSALPQNREGGSLAE